LKRKALFIINPVSGGKKKDGVRDLIKKFLDKAIFEYDIVESEGVLDARKKASDAAGVYDLVVAVGGDGTVNETASGITGSSTALGILPYGSGNGLSRFLGIPMNIEKAIKTLNNWRVETIDSAKANGEWFFNMAGMGIDAHVSNVFARADTRGFSTYIKLSIKEVAGYKSQHYYIDIDGNSLERDAFMLSFANSSQFGNNAHISPHASLQDGLIDVCIVKPFPWYRFPEFVARSFMKTTDKFEYLTIIRGKKITAKRDTPGPMHLDGEPHDGITSLAIEVVPASLKVLVGENFKQSERVIASHENRSVL
jgi:diacylglycerol kinase (ATP)